KRTFDGDARRAEISQSHWIGRDVLRYRQASIPGTGIPREEPEGSVATVINFRNVNRSATVGDDRRERAARRTGMVERPDSIERQVFHIYTARGMESICTALENAIDSGRLRIFRRRQNRVRLHSLHSLLRSVSERRTDAGNVQPVGRYFGLEVAVAVKAQVRTLAGAGREHRLHHRGAQRVVR